MLALKLNVKALEFKGRERLRKQFEAVQKITEIY